MNEYNVVIPYLIAAVSAVVIALVVKIISSKVEKQLMGNEWPVIEKPSPPSFVPESRKTLKAEVTGRGAVGLEERLGVLRAEIRRLLGYHNEDLKDEAGKIKGMIEGGYWVQAADALTVLEGKVVDRRKEKNRYDQFMDKVNIFVKEHSKLFVDDIKAQLSKGDFDKAEQTLSERKKDYERYLELGRSLKDVEEQTTMLSRRLAKGELTSDAYERARDDLESRKKDIDEELWKIQRKIFREKYEKPF